MTYPKFQVQLDHEMAAAESVYNGLTSEEKADIDKIVSRFRARVPHMGYKSAFELVVRLSYYFSNSKPKNKSKKYSGIF